MVPRIKKPYKKKSFDSLSITLFVSGMLIFLFLIYLGHSHEAWIEKKTLGELIYYALYGLPCSAIFGSIYRGIEMDKQTSKIYGYLTIGSLLLFANILFLASMLFYDANVGSM